MQSEKSKKLGRQPKSSTAPDCRAAQGSHLRWVFHVSRKAAGRTQWVAHTRRRSRRRRESRDTHSSGGSQSPVESTPTRLQIHRTGAALEGDSTRIERRIHTRLWILSAVAFWGASDGLRDDVRATLLRLARAQSARQDGEEGAQPPQVSVPITPQAAPRFPNSAAPHFPVTLAFSRRDATTRLRLPASYPSTVAHRPDRLDVLAGNRSS